MRSTARALVPVLVAGVLAGCAGDYVARTRAVRQAYQSYQAERALELLAPEEKGPEQDRLLVLLDKGMILHVAGRFQESIQVLAEAEKLAASLEVISISEEAAALLANERSRAYRGEDFEKLMVNVLQALNYAGLGRDEDALVEIRRVNERLRKMIQEEKKPYEQLAVARYLGGALWEDQGELDSAFIDYQDAARLQPELGELAEPLLRLARATGREEAYQELLRRFPGVPHPPLGPAEGQVLVVVEAGLSPEKHSSRHGAGPELVVVPVYQPRPWFRGPIQIEAGGQQVAARTVTSIDAVAQVHLSDRIGRIIAQSLAGTAVKAGAAVAAGKATKSELVGWLTFLLLTSGNEADLRSWLSLPAEFQVARLRLPAGSYQLAITIGGSTTQRTVEVKPRRIAVVVERRY